MCGPPNNTQPRAFRAGLVGVPESPNVIDMRGMSEEQKAGFMPAPQTREDMARLRLQDLAMIERLQREKAAPTLRPEFDPAQEFTGSVSEAFRRF